MIWYLILSVAVGLFLLFRVTKSPLIAKLIASFDNSSEGFSARKLSAFIGVAVSVIATFRFVDNDTIIEALSVWLIFSLLCLGIITAEQLIRLYKLKKGDGAESIQSNETQEKPEEPKKNDDLMFYQSDENPKI